MALRARSTARASISSAMAYSAITIAASGHWPIARTPGDGHGHQRVDVQRPCRSAVEPSCRRRSRPSQIAHGGDGRPAGRARASLGREAADESRRAMASAQGGRPSGELSAPAS
jgi:hypothetical protein